MGRATQMKELQDQGYSLEEIGNVFHITKQRALQILQKEYGREYMSAFLTRNALRRILGVSESLLLRLERQGILNPQKKGKLYLYQKSNMSKTKEEIEQQQELEKQAYHQKHFVELVCETCGIKFERYRSSIRKTSPGRFCSKHCFGKWLVHKNGGIKRIVARQIFEEIENEFRDTHAGIFWSERWQSLKAKLTFQ